MDLQAPSIQPLPPEVVAQLKSSISISHLNGVVLELLKNSLDAGAHTISINVDFQKGGCVVEDDGQGILPVEFHEGGNLAKPHHTSRFNSRNEVYGRKGLFIASLVSLALVTITSRHESASTTNTVIYHHSKPISRLIPAPLQHDLNSRDHGTRVTVNDLFGNLPVRVKHRALSLRTTQDLDREWDDLKSMLTAILLAFQKHVKVVVSDATKTRKLVFRTSEAQHDTAIDLSRIRLIFTQAGYITPGDFGSWVTASARTSGIEVQSAISIQPIPTKQVQFISFGMHPVSSHSNANVLYNEVNRLFSLSSFGLSDDPPIIANGLEELNLKDDDRPIEGGTSNRKKRYLGKSVNRWPMFYIRIELHGSDKAVNEEDDSPESGKTLQSVLDVLVAMIQQFLEQHHFRPRSGIKRTRQSHSPANRTESRIAKRLRKHTSASPSSTALAGLSRGRSVGELFSTQIKLPDFTHSHVKLHPRFKDFGGWSRIKSNRESGIDDIWSGLPRGKTVSVSNTLENRGLEHVGGYSQSSPATPALSDNLLDESSSGGGIADRRTQSASPGQIGDEGLQDMEVEHVSETADEVMRWTDPVTQKVVFINSRTGQTLPSVNKTLTSREISGNRISTFPSRRLGSGSPGSHPTSWIDTLLKDFENPTFQQSEMPIATAFEVPDLHIGGTHKPCLSGTGDSGFMSSASTFNGRLTKQGLQNSRFISQVDSKFLLLKLPTSTGENNHDTQQILVLVDQHAADERCRVEQLFNELCGAPAAESNPSSPFRVSAASLPKPVSFQVSHQESQLLKSHSAYFETWGCHYTLSPGQRNHYTVTIKKLPTLIAERCRLEPKLAIDLLRCEIWDRKDQGKKNYMSCFHSPSYGISNEDDFEIPSTDKALPTVARHAWLERIGDCPKAITELLNSRACRSSIMFNDSLSREECRNLVSRLALCAFPFQCAHGRPSIIPIVNLGSISSSSERFASETISGFDYMSRFGDDFGKTTAINKDLPFLEAFEAWKPGVL
ncbi:hypothetical protein AJ79_01722 [Helicocarpus griseus UAMH5409]|uniref:MutL C-terminal dimerisation domain-containing protein n=1 Tax=Helicocarpus griseus UAMH5409 TaxID=1447875 RepID=A0A2B7Y5W0_9EURO|nr:hypothetical protein AJ79_01722 [Helicocarpus griseus UAMH5409]